MISRALPLHRDALTHFYPWLLGVVMYAALFSCMVALRLSEPDAGPHRMLIGVPAMVQADQIEAFQTRLLKRPGVLAVHAVISETAQSTLEQLGLQVRDEEGVSRIPRFFGVLFQRDAADAVQTQLKQSEGILWWTHETLNHALYGMYEPSGELGLSIAFGAALFASVLCFAMIGIMLFMVRISLSIHVRTLEVLVLMGADSRYIVRRFLSQSLKNNSKALFIAGILLIVSGVFLQMGWGEGNPNGIGLFLGKGLCEDGFGMSMGYICALFVVLSFVATACVTWATVSRGVRRQIL